LVKSGFGTSSPTAPCDHKRLPFITPNSYRLAVAALWLNVR